MIIYSVTINIKKEVEDSWLTWMKEVHIKDVMNTGYFNNYQMEKMVIPKTDEDESVFMINYTTDSIEKYFEYLNKDAAKLQLEHKQKFSGKFNASRAVFQIIPK